MIRKTRMVLVIAAAVALVLAATLTGCGSGSSGKPVSQPATGPAAGAPADGAQQFKFIVCGDPQNNYEVFDKILEAAKSVDFLIVAGDITGSGTETEFQSFQNVMNKSGVKCYTVPGNHDVAASPVSGNYTTYLGRPYRSFDYKNTHFVLIDNSSQELGFYPQEREWVRADLKSASWKGFEHIIAVAHVPPGYPYSAHADPAQIPGINANHELVPVLSKGGVEELFCGHIHTYMEEPDDGVLVTITGGAGAPLMKLGSGAFHNYVLVEINGRRRSQTVVRI